MSETQSIWTLILDLLRTPKQVALSIGSQSDPWEIILSLFLIVVVGGSVYGVVLGFVRGGRQILSSAIKAPSVPLLSLAITLPLLFVVNAVCGGQATLLQTVAIALHPIAVGALIVLACAPVLAFFGFTSDYHFSKLLHLVVCGVAGIYGLRMLHADLTALGGKLHLTTSSVFVLWIGLYGFVAAQMTWSLRPFIGVPDQPFEWLRRREASQMNFYTAIVYSVRQFLRTRETKGTFRPQVLEDNLFQK